MTQQLGLFGDEPAAGIPGIEPSGDLVALAAAQPAGVRLGTSSWGFPGWRDLMWGGEFSEAVLARRGLAAYARHPLMRTVSIDRTYYAPVASEVLAAYAAAVPETFSFVVKAHDACTTPVWPMHARYGAARGTRNPRFLDPGYAADLVVAPFVDGLGERGGVLVFQVAPFPLEQVGGARRFAEQLYRFLRDLPAGVRYAVELRSPALLTPDYAACLHHARALHCLAVMPTMPPPLAQATRAGVAAQAGLVVRWNLAPGRAYEEAREAFRPFDRLVAPDPDAREELAALVRAAVARGVPAWVAVNNKAEGSAPLSCIALAQEIVGQVVR